ncbi:hypothetical protein BKA61DRAFT_715740 [Leptodontidium sp. MPI-SDFR-AT-0119]|nr:hypothetical protein BKA61DRAFT_715740 [Leptodontidium sp. MPI-SDFR-AT-0119]
MVPSLLQFPAHRRNQGTVQYLSSSPSDTYLSLNPGANGFLSSLQSILSCPNQCGSISVSTNCGFGVLTANYAAAASCFSKAINVQPAGRDPSETPVVGTFVSMGCWTDGVNARALTGRSSTAADMTAEKCIALAKGAKYAGVEYGVYVLLLLEARETGVPANDETVNVIGGIILPRLHLKPWANVICLAEARRLPSAEVEIVSACTKTTHTHLPRPYLMFQPLRQLPPSCHPVDLSRAKAAILNSVDARVLVVDSVTDFSVTGMTVQKCVELAQRRGLKYAGVEYYGPATAGQADCSVPCSGDPTQICGNGNRLQVYEDTSWSNPVVSEVIAALQAYTDKLAEVVEAFSLYKTCLLALQSVQGQKVRKRQNIKRESIELQNPRSSQGKLSPEQRISLERGMETSNLLSRPVLAAIADDQSLAIGMPAWVGPAGVVALGVFFIFAAVISALAPKPGGPDVPITTAPTISTTSTTTTTTSSAATVTGTPYFIVAKIGTKQADFENLVSSLPQSSDDVHISYPLVGVFAHVATINETMLQSIQKNPILETVIPRSQRRGSPSKAKRSTLQNSASHNDTRSSFQKRAARKYPEMVFEPVNVVPQPNSPAQLQMLSQKNWFTDNTASYDGKDYLTERPSGQGTRIYVIDAGIEPHQEYVALPGSAQYVAKGASPTVSLYHGNCVASQAVGATLGVAKDAYLYSAKMEVTLEDSIFDAFVFCVNDAVIMKLQGKATGTPAYIQWAISYGIVVVAAAGNDGDNDGIPTDPSHLIDSVRPSRFGLSIPGFLAVGSIDNDGFRSDFTPKCTIADIYSDCLQAYALGRDVRCATLNNAYEEKTGTSFAAPQVAGLAAYFLTHPNPEVQRLVQAGGIPSVAANVERLIADLSYRRYEGELSDSESPNAPDVIFNGAVLNVDRVAPVTLLQ